MDILLDMRDKLRAGNRLTDTGAVRPLATAAIRAGHTSFAQRLLKQSISMMLAPNQPPRNNLAWVLDGPVQMLVRRRKWEDVVTFTNIAVTHSLGSEAIVTARMHALYMLKRHHEAIQAFELFAQLKLKPTSSAYDDLIGAHLLNADLNAAQVAMSDKAASGHPTTVQTCLALLDGMWLFGGNVAMERKLLEQASPADLKNRQAFRQSVLVLNRLMSVRASRGDLDDTFAILDHFNLDPSSSLHRFMLDVIPGLQQTSSPHFRPEPDLATVVILIGVFLRQRRADLAMSMFVESQVAQLGFNQHLAAAVVRIHLALGNVEEAERFVFDLASGTANVTNLYEDNVEQDSSAHVISLPRIEPAAMVYEALLSGVLRNRGLAGGVTLLKQIVEQRQTQLLPVTDGMVSVLVDYLSAYQNEGTETSAELIVRLYEFTAGGRKPTVRNLNQLLEAAWKNERFRGKGVRSAGVSANGRKRAKLLRERQEMLASVALFPTHGSNGGSAAAVSAEVDGQPRSSSHSSRSASSRIRSSLIDRNVQSDRTSAQHQLRHDGSFPSIGSMWDYLQTSLLDRGMRPTHAHLAVILRAYVRLGDINGAHHALERAFDHLGVAPHVALYSVVIGGAAKLGQVDKTMAVFKEMRDRGVQPDRNLYHALAMSFARRQDPKNVRAVWTQARHKLVRTVGRAGTAPGHVQSRVGIDQAENANASHNKGHDPGSRNDSSGAGADAAPASPADVLRDTDDVALDPIFVSIYYRALVASRHVLEAQHLIKRKLDQGMRPDEATLRALDRTRRHLRWKANQKVRQLNLGETHVVGVPDWTRTNRSGQVAATAATASAGREQAVGARGPTELTIELNLDNLRRVKALVRARRPQGKRALRQLQQMEQYLDGGSRKSSSVARRGSQGKNGVQAPVVVDNEPALESASVA